MNLFGEKKLEYDYWQLFEESKKYFERVTKDVVVQNGRLMYIEFEKKSKIDDPEFIKKVNLILKEEDKNYYSVRFIFNHFFWRFNYTNANNKCLLSNLINVHNAEIITLDDIRYIIDKYIEALHPDTLRFLANIYKAHLIRENKNNSYQIFKIPGDMIVDIINHYKIFLLYEFMRWHIKDIENLAMAMGSIENWVNWSREELEEIFEEKIGVNRIIGDIGNINMLRNILNNLQKDIFDKF